MTPHRPSTHRPNARATTLLLIATIGVLTALNIGRDAAGAALEPESRVIVTLQSGRRFLGSVDPKTDAVTAGDTGEHPGRLWMRFEHGRAVILRPIAWSRVVEVVTEDGEPIQTARLRQLVAQWKRDDPTWQENKAIRAASSSSTPTAASIARGFSNSPVAPTTHVASQPQGSGPLMERHNFTDHKAAGFSFDCYAANWDGDVELDGLVIRVTPFDRASRPVPLDGTLEVNLIGRQDSVVEGPRPFPRIGRWVRRVEPGDFNGGGATYRLPFQAVHPQFDTEIAPYAVVHARLTAAGHGSFDVSRNGVRLRPFSRNRDRLELITGERFFPLERNGRHQ